MTHPATHAREAKVQQCMEIMASGQWVRGKTVRVLAAEWGISLQAARDISAEASRRDAARVTDKEVVRGEACASLRNSLHGAEDDRKWSDVARVADIWTRVVGAREPERVTVASVDVTDPAKREALKRALAEQEGEDE